MTTLTCLQCNTGFPDPTPNRRGRKPSYCSDTCRAAKKAAYRADYRAGRDSYRKLHDLCYDCPEVGTLPVVPGTLFCLAHGARREARRIANTLTRFGLTPAIYAEMFERQGGACAICRTAETDGDRRLAIDHDHACCPGDNSCGDCVRGLLCHSCNLALGLLRDRTDLLAAAAAYLNP